MIVDRSISYRSGYKYQVAKQFYIKLGIVPFATILRPFVEMDMTGNTKILPGYAWDGASGPTWDSKNSMRSSLVHDIGYQLIRLGLINSAYKEYFDQLLRDLCVEDGMFKWRAEYWRWAVIKFGTGSTRPSAEPKIEVAP